MKQRYDGDYDDHLTNQGRRDAEEIASKLADSKISHIFYSSKIRARETADILKEKLHCETSVIPDMDEQNIYGAYAVLGKEQPEEEYRKLGELMTNRENAMDGVESYRQFKTRILDSFSEILKKYTNNVAIVTHGGPIRCILRENFKKDDLKKIGNGAIIELEKNDSEIKILKMDGVVV